MEETYRNDIEIVRQTESKVLHLHMGMCVCVCFYWKSNAEGLSLQQLNVSALFLKGEVSGHTQVHSQMSLGSKAVESNTATWPCSCSREG